MNIPRRICLIFWGFYSRCFIVGTTSGTYSAKQQGHRIFRFPDRSPWFSWFAFLATVYCSPFLLVASPSFDLSIIAEWRHFHSHVGISTRYTYIPEAILEGEMTGEQVGDQETQVFLCLIPCASWLERRSWISWFLSRRKLEWPWKASNDRTTEDRRRLRSRILQTTYIPQFKCVLERGLKEHKEHLRTLRSLL